ncbi:MAG: FtsH protease activity modulator HflK, partial [Sphingomonadales bacterium]|nr:FtsH protease activity modulator HflK [Sphingomonadales bacterium]
MSWQNNGDGPKNPWGQGPRGSGPRGGGSGGGQEPPDLDQIIREGQEKLKSLLPFGGGKGSFSMLFFLLLGLWAASGFYTINPSQQGVVLRFGEWVETQPSGFHWHVPFPIETVLKPNVTNVNRIDVGFRSEPTRGRSQQVRFTEESLMLTGDENIVDIAFTVFWRIDDAGKFLFNLQQPQEHTIKSVSESVMREVVGRTPIELMLTTGRREIEIETQGIIQAVLEGYGAGVTVTEVKLEKVDPPSQVIDDFRDVQAAEADRERVQNEAQAYANSIVPVARGEANRILQDAEAYKEQVVARATGEASRFTSVYTEYKQA